MDEGSSGQSASATVVAIHLAEKEVKFVVEVPLRQERESVKFNLIKFNEDVLKRRTQPLQFTSVVPHTVPKGVRVLSLEFDKPNQSKVADRIAERDAKRSIISKRESFVEGACAAFLAEKGERLCVQDVQEFWTYKEKELRYILDARHNELAEYPELDCKHQVLQSDGRLVVNFEYENEHHATSMRLSISAKLKSQVMTRKNTLVYLPESLTASFTQAVVVENLLDEDITNLDLQLFHQEFLPSEQFASLGRAEARLSNGRLQLRGFRGVDSNDLITPAKQKDTPFYVCKLKLFRKGLNYVDTWKEQHIPIQLVAKPEASGKVFVEAYLQNSGHSILGPMYPKTEDLVILRGEDVVHTTKMVSIPQRQTCRINCGVEPLVTAALKSSCTSRTRDSQGNRDVKTLDFGHTATVQSNLNIPCTVQVFLRVAELQDSQRSESGQVIVRTSTVRLPSGEEFSRFVPKDSTFCINDAQNMVKVCPQLLPGGTTAFDFNFRIQWREIKYEVQLNGGGGFQSIRVQNQNPPRNGSLFGGTQANTDCVGSFFGTSQPNTGHYGMEYQSPPGSGSLFGSTQTNTGGSGVFGDPGVRFGGSQFNIGRNLFGGAQPSSGGGGHFANSQPNHGVTGHAGTSSEQNVGGFGSVNHVQAEQLNHSGFSFGSPQTVAQTQATVLHEQVKQSLMNQEKVDGRAIVEEVPQVPFEEDDSWVDSEELANEKANDVSKS